jgi:hypothetical protein
MTPPLLEEPAPRPRGRLDVFWDRNWKWFVPALCVAAVLLVFVFMAFVFAFMRRSGAYTGALDRARASPDVASALGTPVRDGFFVTGNVNVSGPSGRAQLAIPVSGPGGTGVIYVEATKSLGQWHFDREVMVVSQSGRRIDLSGGQPAPYRPPDDRPEPEPPVTR